MNEKEFNYLTDKLHLLGAVRWTSEQAATLTAIYNRITGEKKPITSCGRCVLNIKNRLKLEYAKYNNND